MDEFSTVREKPLNILCGSRDKREHHKQISKDKCQAGLGSEGFDSRNTVVVLED